MKKILSIVTIIVLSLTLIACQHNRENDINVGVQFYPMKDLLLLIEDDIKAEGYNLVIHEYTDLQTPNMSLAAKELDANMIQHELFLQLFNNANNKDLEIVAPIYHATFALYSKSYTKIEDIPNNSKIIMPGDATNYSRALYLLAQANLITLTADKVYNLTVDDVLSNPKNLDLTVKNDLATIAQRYVEEEFAIMYPTYARTLQLEGDEQRLYVEKQDEVTFNYVIAMAARSDNKDSDKIKVLIKHLQSDKVKQFLIDNYAWASKPAF